MADTDPLDHLIQEARAFVDGRPAPDFVNAVMGRVEQLGTHHAKTPASWITRFGTKLWAPLVVTVEFRPAYALVALAGALMFAAVLPYQRSIGNHPPMVATTQAVNEKVYVQFRLQASEASDVRLAGSFTHWQPQYQLHETAPGLWTVMLPLEPGVHDYAFIVDGRRWVTDPYAPTIQDGFGGTNSRITLVGGGDRRL
jgi:hypothetical protein